MCGNTNKISFLDNFREISLLLIIFGVFFFDASLFAFQIKPFSFYPHVQLTDVLFAELPRVRLDRIRRPSKFLFDAHPTLSEVPEECEGYLDGGTDDISQSSDFRLDLNTTLTSPLGKYTYKITHFEVKKNRMKCNKIVAMQRRELTSN